MKDKMPSARFRRQLKEQLPILQSEGLLTPQQSQSLFARYQLDALSSEAMNTLLSVIYTIGAVLIAIGVISFVAAHWEDIGRTTKIIMIFAVMLIAHGTGFYLWQIRGSYPKLGHALVLLGTLIFGANIGLIAQIFHINENPYNGFFAWSVGAVILAYTIKSIPNAAAAVFIFSIYAIGNLIDNHPSANGFSPLIAIVLFVPFIYYSRSIWVLTMTLLLLSISIPWTLTLHDYRYDYYYPYEWAFSIGLVLTGFLFFNWGTLSRQKETWSFISTPAWLLGILCSAIILYLCSFMEFGDNLSHDNKLPYLEWSSLVFAAIVLVTGLGLLLMSLNKRSAWIPAALQILITVFLAVVIILPYFAIPYLLVTVANILFLLMIILLFIASFTYEDRRIFWASVLMAALLILSRTLEYETELLIKAIIFTACGVGIIIAGVMFERFLKARRLSHA